MKDINISIKEINISIKLGALKTKYSLLFRKRPLVDLNMNNLVPNASLHCPVFV